MRFSIRIKLTVSLLLILLFVVLYGFYSVIINKKTLEETVGWDSQFLAEDTLSRIDKDIFLKIEEAQLFTQNSSLQNALIESNEAYDRIGDIQGYINAKDKEWIGAPKNTITPFMEAFITNELSDILRRRFIEFWEHKYGQKIYGEAFVTNKYGANIAQTGKTTDFYQEDEEWWQKAKEHGFFVGEAEYDESAGVLTAPIGVRIDDTEGNFLGVIKTVPIIGDIVREAVLATKKYQTTEATLLTEDGRLIFSTTAFRVFEDVSDREFFKNHKGKQGFFVIGEGAREKLFAYAHSKGFRDFEGLKWILLIEHDAAEVFLPARQLERTVVIISFLFLLLIGIFAIVLSRTISRPIQKLIEGVEYISKGNLDVKIRIDTQDEIGQLAAAFNEMTVKLKESYQDLERKVKERTKQLEERIGELDRTSKMLVRRDFELLGANELLRETDEAKSRFVSVAAHQLRTPLSGIKWTVLMLLSEDFGGITKDQKEALSGALITLERLAKLITDLLDVARIEGGKFTFTFSSVHIEEVCRKVFNESAAEAKNRGISMNLNLPEEPLPRVRGDFENLAVAIQNIVENAIIYTPKGGVIDLTVMKDPRDLQRVRVSVKDTGMGIPDEQKGLVGEKFFRADNVVREQIPGTGLGLYIVKRILAEHKGALLIESEEGKGSVFSLTLPFVE